MILATAKLQLMDRRKIKYEASHNVQCERSHHIWRRGPGMILAIIKVAKRERTGVRYTRYSENHTCAGGSEFIYEPGLLRGGTGRNKLEEY
jgi:hypothetical protein